MGSYSNGSNILMMPNQSPFDITQNPIANTYLSAMMKKKFGDMEDADKQKKKDAMYQKYLKQAQDSGQTIEHGFTDSGPTFKTQDPDELTNSDILQASLGMGSDRANKVITKRLGASPYEVAARNPSAAMSMTNGGVGDINEQPITPTALDTRSYVSGALGKMPSLKVNQDAVKAENSTTPETFQGDFDQAYASSNDDGKLFISQLKKLSKKYSTNKAALDIIKNHINIQQEKEGDDDVNAFNFK